MQPRGAARRAAGAAAVLAAGASLLAPGAPLAETPMPDGFLPCFDGALYATADRGALLWSGLDGTRRTVHTLDGGDQWAIDQPDAGACSPDGRWAVLFAGLAHGRPPRLFRVTAAGAAELSAPAGLQFWPGPMALSDTALVVSGRTAAGAPAILWGDTGGAAGSAAAFVTLAGYRPMALARTPARTVRFVWAPESGAVALGELGPDGAAIPERHRWPAAAAAALSPDGAIAALVEGLSGAVVALRATVSPPGLPAGAGADRTLPPRPGGAAAPVDARRVLFPAARWSGLRFSRDGRRVAAFEERPREKPPVRLRVAEDGRALPGSVALAVPPAAVAVDPALRLLAVPSATAHASIDLLALPGGALVRRVAGLPPTVPGRDHIAFSPDGATLFLTRTTLVARPARAAGDGAGHHLTQDLWAVPVAGGVPRLLARIIDRDEVRLGGDE